MKCGKKLLGVGGLGLMLITSTFCRPDYDFGGQAAGELNGAIKGEYELENPEVDPSVEVSGNNSSGGMGEVTPGGTMNVSISFNAPNANIVGGGIRFGANGPIQVVTVPDAMGQTSGTLNFAIQVPPSVCNNLSQICHDIQCYEFAVTDAGNISAANINDVALACGNCDEPSCQDLLDSCDIPSGPSCEDYLTNYPKTGNSCTDRCVDDLFDCTAANDCNVNPCTGSYQSCVTSCY